MNKRVLYVDRTPRDEREGKMTKGVLLKLQENYEIETQTNLSYETIYLLDEKAKKNRDYDVLLTHVPYNKHTDPLRFSHLNKREFYKEYYSRSLDILRKIKETYPKMPILAYTGANNDAEMNSLLGEVTEGVVFKSLDCDEDALKIGMALEKLLA